MDYRHLGRSGLLVSPLCLGTMNFGPQTSEADSFGIMDSALASGINFFDTANGYGGGETEQIVGRWFAKGGGRREKVVLATKVRSEERRVGKEWRWGGAAAAEQNARRDRRDQSVHGSVND